MNQYQNLNLNLNPISIQSNPIQSNPIQSNPIQSKKIEFVKVKHIILLMMISLSSFNTFAQISYSTLYNSTTFNNAINLSLPVGSVGGSDATSSSGSAAYTIPITIPVGTNGIVPQLSLQYSSSGNNNILGWGWNISGLSNIYRNGTDIYHDGKVNGVKFTNDDVYLLDGSRLVATTGTNGANNSIYNTEVESYNKITSLGTSGTGPDYFTVLTKDGNTIEYGNTSDSKVLDENSSTVAIWRINKMTDVNGNYIEFKYINTDRDFRIDEINYTGNSVTGMLPYNKVKFNYDEREDKNILYDAGAKFVSKYLLNDITITGEAGVFFKKYNLKYGKGDLYSFLMEVEEVGSDNTVLNPTKFLYGEIEEDVSKVSSSVIINKTEDYFSGDFDGDGYSDLVGFNRNIANVTNLLFYDKFTVYKRDALNPNHYQSNTTNIPNNSIFPKWGEVPNALKNFSSDFDADGDDDILIANVATNISTGNLEFLDNVTIYYSSNNATVFTPTVYVAPTLSGTTYNHVHNNNFILQGDFDGDGGGDFITFVTNGNTKGFFSSPTKGVFNEFIYSLAYTDLGTSPDFANELVDANKLMTADFDGDGKTDIICTDGLRTRIYSINKESGTGYNYKANIIYNTGYPTAWHSLLLGDFNGDGKTDFFTKVNGGQWDIAYSTGTSVITKQFIFQHSPEIFQSSNNYHLEPQTDDHLDLGDFNGDGKTDILVQYENYNYTNNYYDLYYSIGDLNTSTSTNNFAFKHFIQNGGYNMGRHLLGDFNGDGRHDFIDRGAYFNPIDFVRFGANNQERLLKKVSNGMGHVTEYNYDLLTSAGSFYIKDNTVSYPLNDIQPAIYAVSSIKTPDGIGGTNETKFSYEGLKLHKQGRGLLGFRDTKIENVASSTLTNIENSINTTYYVTKDVKTKVFNTVTNALVSVVENKDVFTNIAGFRFKLQNEETKTTNWLSGSEIKIVKLYDGYGNISESTETVDALETIYTRTSYGGFANTIPNRPTKVTIEKTRLGQPMVSKEIRYNYDVKGRIIEEKEFPTLAKWVAKNYTYDQFGNVLTSTISGGQGAVSSTITKTYDTKGRFALSIQNPLLQTEYYDYTNPMFGNPFKKTTIGGLETEYEYDGFGRNTKITSIDPIGINNFETLLNVSWNGSNGSIAKTNTTTGKPATIVALDMLGREIVKLTVGFNSQLMFSTNEYNNKGQLIQSSKPFLWTQTPIYNTFTYDDYGRMISSTDATTGTAQKTYNYIGTDFEETTILPSGNIKKLRKDASGKLIKSVENNTNATIYDYDSWGNNKSIYLYGSGTILTNTFDDYGRMIASTDMNAGTKSMNYNAYGQVTSETNANGHVTNYVYDILGRVVDRNGVEGNTHYTYLNTPGVNINKLSMVTGFNGIFETYSYNGRGSIDSKSKTITGNNAATYVTNYTYDNFENLLEEESVNDGFKLKYEYDANGYLLNIKNNAGNKVYEIGAVNEYGQITDYILGNGLVSKNEYIDGHLIKKQTTGVQDYEMEYDWTSGNITKRQDHIYNLTEDLQYDNFNRLTHSNIAGVAPMVMNYMTNGNITKKTDAQGNFYQYAYNSVKRNAVEKIINIQNPNSPALDYSPIAQTIAYTPFDRAQTINEGNYEYNLTYGPDYQRASTELKNNGAITKEKHYIDNMEVEFDNVNGTTTNLHYIEGLDGLVAIAKIVNGVEDYFYTYTDHLGSILTMTDKAGVIVAEQSFDVWGRNRNPHDWTYNSLPTTNPTWLSRGYTMHEHLPEFNLINMNARLYDPMNGRMLSPDKFIQDATNSQNLNRFSYALNNPMSYTDPSGNISIKQVANAIRDKYQSSTKIEKVLIWGGVDILTGGTLSVTMGGTFAIASTTASVALLHIVSSNSTPFSAAFQSFGAGFLQSLRKEGDLGKAFAEGKARQRNSGRIWAGQFNGDATQIVKRHTWETFQNGIGLHYGLLSNQMYEGVEVGYFKGATTIAYSEFYGGNRSAVTIGSYIQGGSYLEPNANNKLLQHEYGHYLQSQKSGILYLFKYGIPSIMAPADIQQGTWTEIDANSRSQQYWDEHYNNIDWNYDENPIGEIRNPSSRDWLLFLININPILVTINQYIE